MANDLSIFSNEKFGSVRVVMQGGEPWFVAKDVLRTLDYADDYNPSRAMQSVPEEWKGMHRIHTLGGSQEMLIISEPGLYFFLGRSDKSKAVPYQKWVAGDIVPSIRKNGYYSAVQSISGPLSDRVAAAQIIFRAANLKDNQLTLALDKVYRSNTGQSALEAAGIQLKAPMQTNMLTPTEIGAMLAPHMSAKAVNRVLEAQGLQYRLPNGKWEPTELADEYGYVLIDTNKRHSDGTPVTQLKWSTKVLDIVRR